MIRIFVGCAPNNEDMESQSVLEWSLRKHSSMPIEIEWMQLSRDPNSFWFSDPRTKHGWNTADWTTPFSGFRWGVPARCGYQGKAIYTDSDMIVMADIAELWNQPFRDEYVAVISKAASERFCVSLFDCARMRKHVPDINLLKSKLGHFRTVRRAMTGGVVQAFQGNWNCMDDELRKYKSLRDPDIKMLHYTDIPTQLQLKYSLPRLTQEGGRHWFKGHPQKHPRSDFQQLFDEMLAEAIANGYPPERYRREPFGDHRLKWAA